MPFNNEFYIFFRPRPLIIGTLDLIQRWAELDFEAKLASEPSSLARKKAAKKRVKKIARESG